jgi:hypothetical protein
MVSLLSTPVPTTAERIRSACARGGGALLAVEAAEPKPTPLCHLLGDGSFAVAMLGPVAPSGTQAMLELTDYAPLPMREPVRSLVWVRGRLQRVALDAVPELLDLIASENPHPALLQIHTPRAAPTCPADDRSALLRLEIESVVVTDATGAEAVSTADLLAARPDPFCEVESTLLWHLTTAHEDVVARLVSKLPTPLRRGQVRPLGLDRYGVRFRVESGDGDHDIRLPFHKPVDDMTGLSQAIRVLMGCPFLNGLRPRR